MDEYIMPARYQNMGCGISAKIAGLEPNRDNYKQLRLSIDNKNWIDVPLDEGNHDISNIATFDNLQEDKYYTVYGQVITKGNNVIELSVKIVSQCQTAMVKPPLEIRKRRYLGGALVKGGE